MVSEPKPRPGFCWGRVKPYGLPGRWCQNVGRHDRGVKNWCGIHDPVEKARRKGMVRSRDHRRISPAAVQVCKHPSAEVVADHLRVRARRAEVLSDTSGSGKKSWYWSGAASGLRAAAQLVQDGAEALERPIGWPQTPEEYKKRPVT